MNRSSKTRSPIASLLALRSVSPRLAVLPLVALSAGCFTVQSGESVASLIRTTRYQEALDLAASRAERAPKDREAQEDLNRAEAVWLVDRGRDQVFAGEHQSALASFQAAAERLPENRAIRDWVRKANGELAAEYRALAYDNEGAGDLDLASANYSKALSYVPDDAIAKQGLERVGAVAEHRAQEAGEYHRRGIRKQRQRLFWEALHNFQTSGKFDPDNPDNQERLAEVEAQLAEERWRLGADLEGQGLFRAALLEYQSAERYGSRREEVSEDIARMRNEIEVLELLAEAERRSLASDFDSAFDLLARAGEQTELLGDVVEGARNEIQVGNIERRYDLGRELEDDFRYPEAIVAYTELLEVSGGFYLDAISRRDTLRDHVIDAERLYQAARETTNVEERLGYLRQIRLIWPTYKDVGRELARLE